MSYTILPSIAAAGRHEYEIELGEPGRIYSLSFTWHERIGSWYLDIKDSQGVPIRTGIRIVSDWPLYGRSRLSELPGGALFAVDVSGSGKDISGQVELGARVQLVFVPSEDLPEPSPVEAPTFKVLP